MAGNRSEVVTKTITVDSVLPRLNSASVINKTTVEVSFSEDVVSAELPEHYLIAPSLGNFLTAKKDSKVYQLIFTQSIPYNTLFTVKAVGITDLAGNAVDTGHDTAQFQRQAVERIYIYHNNKRIAMEENGVKYFYLHDHLGSTNVVTDENGKQVEHYEYTAYGDTQIEEGSLDVAKKFTGKELDDSTGLYDYGARMYDPVIGRFITADPLEFDEDDVRIETGKTLQEFLANPQKLNRYSYCLNNPLKYIDPTGRDVVGIHGGLGGSPESVKAITEALGKSYDLPTHYVAWRGISLNGTIPGVKHYAISQAAKIEHQKEPRVFVGHSWGSDVLVEGIAGGKIKVGKSDLVILLAPTGGEIAENIKSISEKAGSVLIISKDKDFSIAYGERGGKSEDFPAQLPSNVTHISMEDITHGGMGKNKKIIEAVKKWSEEKKK